MLQPYRLPAAILERLLALAAQSEILLLGEFAHGTRTVPELVAGLLDHLDRLGYGALGLEVSIDQDKALDRYARRKTDELPPFVAKPSPDGIGNRELLALTRLAAAKGWAILSMDMGAKQAGPAWQERDRWMAKNLLALRAERAPGKKTLVIAGGMHTRLTDLPTWSEVPAFLAGNLQEMIVGKVASIAIVPHGGTCAFQGGVREVPVYEVEAPLRGAPELRSSSQFGHTMELHLPDVLPATVQWKA